MDFTLLPDLASRLLSGSVTAANDEAFAERENLINPHPPTHAAEAFGHKGKVYDGWETRRRRAPGHDWAIVRLGAAGVIQGIVVDTSHFRGNYPPEVSIEATSAEGYPSVEELIAGPWETIVARSTALGDTTNSYPVDDPRRWTHVRLSIYPDGGVARLRVHGEVVPDPRFLTGTVDLVALENGGRLVDCSDAFYSSPANLILPGRARIMGEGWENARRRGDGNDYATYRLAAVGRVRQVEIDTSYFVGNAPGWIRLAGALDDAGAWTDLVPKVAVQPDTRHRFLTTGAPVGPVGPVSPVGHVRLDVYPDGGLSRLRVYGELPPESLAQARRRWWETLPDHHRAVIPAEAP